MGEGEQGPKEHVICKRPSVMSSDTPLLVATGLSRDPSMYLEPENQSRPQCQQLLLPNHCKEQR